MEPQGMWASVNLAVVFSFISITASGFALAYLLHTKRRSENMANELDELKGAVAGILGAVAECVNVQNTLVGTLRETIDALHSQGSIEGNQAATMHSLATSLTESAAA